MATKEKTRSMPRASAKITLMFGIVSIPIGMRPSVRDRRKDVAGRLLCPDHMEPLKQLYQCEHDPKKPHTMTKGETVTGYETAQDSGQYVVIEDDVIESLVQSREAAAQVRQIVPTGSIDPIFYEKQYVAWPQDGAGQPYDLLLSVLRTDNVSAIFTATISKQTRAFSIRWSEPAQCLVVSLLHFDTDVRWEDGETVAASVADRAGSITDEHVAMARTLCESLAGDFDPSEVEDTYTEALRELIRAKADGKTIEPGKREPKAQAQEDLLASLKASVSATATKKPAKTKVKA